MTELTEIANKIGRLDKGTTYGDCHGFTEFYYPYFEQIKNKAIKNNEKIYILEIGIWEGNSLKLYNEYFGEENCEIYGLDIDLNTNTYTNNNVHLYYTNQNSIEELQKTTNNFKDIKFDIIIDDGGHAFNQQFNTLIAYHNLLKNDGIYILEDLHSNVSNKFNTFNTKIFGEKYIDSPLYFLTTKNKPATITDEHYNELIKCIKDIRIFIKNNSYSPCGNVSITSILKIN